MEPIVNPTKEQLKTLRSIIYLIRHKESEKCYVGQTRRSFRNRYGLTKWWNKVSSPYLKRAITKYGPESFEIIILEHSITDRALLNTAEERWARHYHAYHPTGYNLAPCGQEPIESVASEYRYRAGNKNARHFKIKEVSTGIIHEGVNFTKFCRERGLHRVHVWEAMKEKGRVANGFCAVETTDADIRSRLFLTLNPKIKLPTTLWKEGKNYFVHDIDKFVEEHDLKRPQLIDLLKNRVATYRGFSLYEITPPKRIKHKKFEWIELVDEGGNIIHIKSLYQFCQEKGLNPPHMYALANGHAVSRSGYRLHAVKMLN